MEVDQETQAQSSQRMYDARAQAYDKSWHPDYTRRFTSLLDIQPGARILDLCCGTGLITFAAAKKAGPGGIIVGVDISNGMLAEARRRQETETTFGSQCFFIAGDVTKLDSTLASLEMNNGDESDSIHYRREERQPGKFDWIICCNAFVLLENPMATLASWSRYLSNNGRIALDIPHEHHFRPSIILEQAAERIGVKLPFSRSWVKSSTSFIELAEQQGFTVDSHGTLDNVTGGSAYYGAEQAHEQFESSLKGPFVNLAIDDIKGRLWAMFQEEWGKCAVDGKVANSTAFYYYILRRA